MKTFIAWCALNEFTCHVSLWLACITLYFYFDESAISYGIPGVVAIGAAFWIIVAAFIYPCLKAILEAIESQGEKDE